MSSQQVQVRKKPQPWPEQIRVSGECWLWSGGVHKGYGRYAGEQAHRAVYRDLVGPIPLGLELDHTCKTPLCVNPAHLEPVTRAENQRRRAAAQTHCRNGHEFTLKNTYIHTTPRGLKVRHCRACNRAASQRQALKKRGVR